MLGFQDQTAVLVCTLSVSPANPKVGDNITVEMIVTLLDPEIWAINVTPSTISMNGTGKAVLISGPVPEVANFTLGEVYAPNISFTWTFRTIASGSITFSGFAVGYSPVLEGEVQSKVCNISINVEEGEAPPIEEVVDLKCVEMSANITEAQVNETIRVEAVIVAEGNFTQLTSKVGFYLGHPEEGKLLAMTFANFTQEVALMKVWCELRITQEGEFEIYVYADYSNEIAENNEENNICSVKVVASLPEAYPTSPTPPPTETPAPPTETGVPSTPTSPTAPPEIETPTVEERGIPTSVLVVGAVVAGAVASYLAWRIFYSAGVKEVLMRCCCLDWNVRSEGTILRTVKPVSRDIRVRDGEHKGKIVHVIALFAPVGGYLPLVTKGVNVDWINARGILRSCDSGSGSKEVSGYSHSGRVAGSVSIPIPENLSFKWEIISGPGYLLSTPPLSHTHSSVAEGPAAIYVAPPFVEEDPNQHPADRVKGREVLIKLTVDDPEGQLEGLDSPVEERYFRIILVGQGLELLDKGVPLRENDLEKWVDYSEVKDAISLEEFDWIRPSRTPEPSSEEIKDIKAQLEKVQRRRKAEEETLRYNSEILSEKRRKLDKALSELNKMKSELEDVERQIENPAEAARRARKEAREKIEEKYMSQIEQRRQKKRDLWESHVEEVSKAREKGKSDEYILDLNKRYAESASKLDKEIAKLLQEMWREIERARKEIGYPTIHPPGPGPGFERYRRSLERRREELRKKIPDKEREVKDLRDEVEELERALKGLRKKIDDLKSEETRLREGLRSAEARAEAEKECRPMYEWEEFRPIDGKILAPLKLYDWEPILGSESPAVEQSSVEVRPREILILKARAEDVDRLRIWIKDGQKIEVEVKDWLRYEWSSRWTDDRRHSADPGMFLVTREGETVIFLAPEEEGEIEITCKVRDSGIQGRDPELSIRRVLKVVGKDPFAKVEEGIGVIEKAITRPKERGEEIKLPAKKLGDLEEWEEIKKRREEELEEKVKLPAKKLGDLEEWILTSYIQLNLAQMTGRLLKECIHNLKVRWWADLLWYMGNVLLAVAGAPVGGAAGLIEWIGWAIGYGITGGLIGYEGTAQLLSRLDLAKSSMYEEWVEDLKPTMPSYVAKIRGTMSASGLEFLLYRTGASIALQEGCSKLLFETFANQALAFWRAYSKKYDSIPDEAKACYLLNCLKSEIMLALGFVRPSKEDLEDFKKRLSSTLEGVEDERQFFGLLSALFTPIRYLTGSEEGFERVSLTLENIVDALTSNKEAAVSETIRMFRNVISTLRKELELQKIIFEGLESLRV